MNFNVISLIAECNYTTSRSSGAGGQHVNKVETRVTISFDIAKSEVFTEDQKVLLLKKLRTNKSGIISISSQRYKSQLKNKEDVKGKLVALIEKALVVEKKRKKTKISKEAKLKRLKEKRMHSELKKSRVKPHKNIE